MRSRPGTFPRRNTAGRPAEIRPNSDDAAPPGIDFVGLLGHLLTETVGNPIERERDFDGLVQMLRTYKAERELPWTIPDQRTLLNWCNGDVVPQWRLFEPVWQYLFRGTPDNHPQRVRLKQLWQVAEDAKNASSQAKRRTVADPTHSADLGPDDVEPGASDWKPENAEPLNPGVAVLRVHAPPTGSNTPLVIPLKVDLAFGEAQDWVEDQYVMLSLTEALLTPDFKGCRPVEGTKLGSPDKPHGNLYCPADVWHVRGPRVDKAHLEGEPAGADPLCAITCNGDDSDSVTLILRSSYRALSVVPEHRDTDPNLAKDKVLQALLQKCQQRDRDGFVVWGRASLKRKPPQ